MSYRIDLDLGLADIAQQLAAVRQQIKQLKDGSKFTKLDLGIDQLAVKLQAVPKKLESVYKVSQDLLNRQLLLADRLKAKIESIKPVNMGSQWFTASINKDIAAKTTGQNWFTNQDVAAGIRQWSEKAHTALTQETAKLQVAMNKLQTVMAMKGFATGMTQMGGVLSSQTLNSIRDYEAKVLSVQAAQQNFIQRQQTLNNQWAQFQANVTKAVPNNLVSFGNLARSAIVGMGSSLQTAGRSAVSFGGAIATAFQKARAAVATVNKSLAATGQHTFKSISLIDSWWQHFGRIAIGFTIAYRAMNAFENLLTKTFSTIKTAITEYGELASLQSKLAMFTTLASRGTIEFADGMKMSAMSVQALAKEASTSIIGIAELSAALDETAQQGVLIPPKLMPAFVDFANFTAMIAQTTGSDVRQLRSEIQNLGDGSTRAGNALIRTMKSFGILNEEELKILRKSGDRQEIFYKVIQKVSDAYKDIKWQRIATDSSVAYQVWEKSIRRVMTASIELAGREQKNQNIIAATISERVKKWNQAFSGDLAKNVDAQRFAIMMTLIAQGVDKVMSAFEKMILFVGQLATAFYNMEPRLKSALKAILAFEGVILITKIFGTLYGMIRSLNLVWITFISTFNSSLLAGLTTSFRVLGFSVNFALAPFIGLGIAAFTVGSVISTLTGYTINLEEPVNKLAKAISWLADKFAKLFENSSLTLTALGAMSGFLISGPLGALIGGSVGFGAGLTLNAQSAKGLTKELKVLEGQLSATKKRIDDLKTSMTALKPGSYIYEQKAVELNALEKSYVSLTQKIANINNRLKSGKTFDFNKELHANMLNSFSAIGSSLLTLATPFGDALGKIWEKMIQVKKKFPNMQDLTGDFPGIPTKPTDPQKVADDLYDSLHSITTNVYQRLQDFVKSGNISMVNALLQPSDYAVEGVSLSPVLAELTAQEATLLEHIDKVKQALSLNTVPEKAKISLTVWKKQLIADLSESEAQLDELKQKMATVADTDNLTTATRINKLINEFEAGQASLNASFEQGTKDYREALASFINYYKNEIASLPTLKVEPGQEKSINELIEKLEKLKSTIRANEKEFGTWSDYFQRGLDSIINDNSISLVQKAVEDFASSTEDAFVNFAKEGKSAFKGLADSVIADITRMVVRMALLQPIAGYLSGAMPDITSFFTSLSGGFKLANGGIIDEEVIGYGLTSGKKYNIGENGAEVVTPLNKLSSSGETTINIYNAPAGTTASTNVTKTKTGQKIDIYLDKAISALISSPSRTSAALRQNGIRATTIRR